MPISHTHVEAVDLVGKREITLHSVTKNRCRIHQTIVVNSPNREPILQ